MLAVTNETLTKLPERYFVPFELLCIPTKMLLDPPQTLSESLETLSISPKTLLELPEMDLGPSELLVYSLRCFRNSFA